MPVYAPHPQEPEASEVSWNCGRVQREDTLAVPDGNEGVPPADV